MLLRDGIAVPSKQLSTKPEEGGWRGLAMLTILRRSGNAWRSCDESAHGGLASRATKTAHRRGVAQYQLVNRS
jgi:hypothetical protein